MNASNRMRTARHADRQSTDLSTGAVPPQSLADVGAPSNADYSDVFALSGPFAPYRAGMWAEALFTHAAGRAGQFIWRRVLRLQLGRLGRPPMSRAGRRRRLDRLAGDEDIAGWRVVEQRDDWIRLAASGSLLTGNLVVHVEPHRVLLGTYVWFDSRFGGWLWGRLAPIHRRAAPDLLREGLADLQGSA